jgi:hypothetical protein
MDVLFPAIPENSVDTTRGYIRRYGFWQDHTYNSLAAFALKRYGANR